jgi:hypothetical protein
MTDSRNISDRVVAASNANEDAQYELNGIIINLGERIVGLEAIATSLASLVQSQQTEINNLNLRLDMVVGIKSRQQVEAQL